MISRVITLGTLTLAITVSSCAHQGGGNDAAMSATSTPNLAGTAWRVEEMGSVDVSDSSRATLQFDAEGRVSGSTGCNDFTGTATIQGASLTFSPLATTRRACEGALMEEEQSFLAAMQSVRTFSIDKDGRLRLLSAGGHQLLRLSRVNP